MESKIVRIPERALAEEMLAEAVGCNPGPWGAHSRHVAEAAQAIALRLSELDPDAAYVLGLLHDMGRRAGVTGLRHVLDGYRHLAALGYADAARTNMTHSFAVKDLRAIFGEWDCTPDEIHFIEAYLAGIEFDDYDRLIQLCDSLAMADGFVLMEKRMLDVAMRYGGVNDVILEKWRAKIAIQADFERRMGCSVYRLLPGVVRNTFGSLELPGEAKER